LGAYQEEQSFSMGLNGDDAEAAANLRNIIDGSNASQQRKHKENSVFIGSARLNWIGNGHPLYQHLEMQAMCTLSGKYGDYDRFTPITSRPVKAIKAADGYDEMMRSAKDGRVMALLQTTDNLALYSSRSSSWDRSAMRACCRAA
jgi:hypothetical protein